MFQVQQQGCARLNVVQGWLVGYSGWRILLFGARTHDGIGNRMIEMCWNKCANNIGY